MNEQCTTTPTARAGHASMGARRVDLDVLWDRGARLASALAAHGARENEAVAILMRNDLCFLEGMIATSMLGAYAVPINWHQTGHEVAYILKDSGATIMLAHADLLAHVQAELPPHVRVFAEPTCQELRIAYGVPAPECEVPAHVDTLQSLIDGHGPMKDGSRVGTRGSIVYTSGTTGRPKGVRRFALDPDAARAFGKLSQQWFDLRPNIRTAMAGPMYHSAPNTYARAVLQAGGSIALMPRFDAEGLLALIEQERITHLHLVPTMFVRLLRLPAEVRHRYDLGSLEFVIHGAAPCSHEIKRAMIEWWGPVIHEYYGATEMGMVSRASSQEWLARPGTVGRPWPGREVRIYGDDGQRLGAGQIGEIYASLHGVPDFSYQNADAERAAVERGGLVSNGDVGHLDDDGFLFLADRKRDMVISGGVNIYPAEIECVLIEHPAVADCAVIGLPDEEYGEKLAAFVCAAPGPQAANADELMRFLRGRIAGFKVPRSFIFVDTLPRDDSGKLMKRKLKDQMTQTTLAR